MPLSRLNQEQLDAATAPNGQNLIIASAGTGKTSTIVGRIGHLLKIGVKPEEILLLTFTNKAAAEMVERLAGYFSSDIAHKIEAGTFHAVSYRWLKKFDKKIVLKQPAELKTLFRSVYDKRSFHLFDHETSPYGANYLYDVYSLYQNTEVKRGFDEWMKEKNAEHSPYVDIYIHICEEFENLKVEYGFVNFNDLLILMREKMKDFQMPYKEVLVDEYQDTNALQGAVVDAMNPPSLFCVGDYDQSIYAFNGADITIIGSFSEKFPDAKVYTLSKNYRSTVPILSLANKVIEYNERIYPKKLEFTREAKAVPPKLLIYEELFEQYSAISQMIRKSYTPSDEIAVIFRNNASADGMEATLREIGLPCKRKGGKSFFDAKEVKAILDIYVLFVNSSDMMAFIHLFEYAKGIGSAIAKELFIALKKLGKGSLFEGLFHPDQSIRNPFEKRQQNHQLGLFDDFIELGSVAKFMSLGFEENFLSNPVLKHPKFSKESAQFLYDFYLLSKSLKRITQPSSMIEKIRASSFYNTIIDQLAVRRAQLKDGTTDERLKTEALERIKRKGALLFDLAKPYKAHERYINAMVLGSQDLTKGEGVNLLSVHASKGLEYKEVYVVDLMDGRFPNRKLMNKGGGGIEEERRLFYVAVTRAKDILYLSYAKNDKIKKMDFVPSQFLYEAGLLKKDENYTKMVEKAEAKE
jgi:DNA helicase-2/ATP-dependent DNA helicase PcrA